MKSTHKNLLLLLSFILVFISCEEKQNSNKPKQAISYEKAKKLQTNYINTRVKPIREIYKNAGIDKIEDVRDLTFDLEVMKQYIAYVEKEAKKKGINKGLGLRVYLGAYQKGDVTMFFMPTKKKETVNEGNSFFYFDPGNEIIDGIDGLNMGQAGKPPKDLD